MKHFTRDDKHDAWRWSPGHFRFVIWPLDEGGLELCELSDSATTRQGWLFSGTSPEQCEAAAVEHVRAYAQRLLDVVNPHAAHGYCPNCNASRCLRGGPVPPAPPVRGIEFVHDTVIAEAPTPERLQELKELMASTNSHAWAVGSDGITRCSRCSRTTIGAIPDDTCR